MVTIATYHITHTWDLSECVWEKLLIKDKLDLGEDHLHLREREGMREGGRGRERGREGERKREREREREWERERESEKERDRERALLVMVCLVSN